MLTGRKTEFEILPQHLQGVNTGIHLKGARFLREFLTVHAIALFALKYVRSKHSGFGKGPIGLAPAGTLL
jgi:hypothetical protein